MEQDTEELIYEVQRELRGEPLIFEETQEEKDLQFEEDLMHIEKVAGLTIEKIMFMKGFFKQFGFDPEDENFEEKILLTRIV